MTSFRFRVSHYLNKYAFNIAQNQNLSFSSVYSHDAGSKQCGHKMNTVCNCSHDARSMISFGLVFFLICTLVMLTIFITVKMSRQRNSYGYMFTQHRDGRISLRFQTLTVYLKETD